MQRIYPNIYKTARQSAGFTQEQAAELLHLSIRSLSDYEGGKTIPGDDIVCGMIETYKTEWLGYEHLKRSAEVGQRYLPDIDLTDLAKSVLRLQKEVADVVQVNPDMVEVACDGIVDGHEEEKWQTITKEINDMAGAALAVGFSQKERALV